MANTMKEAVERAVQDGWTQAQIAQEVETTPSNLSRLLGRDRHHGAVSKRLRKWLTERGYFSQARTSAKDTFDELATLFENLAVLARNDGLERSQRTVLLVANTRAILEILEGQQSAKGGPKSGRSKN